MSRDRLTYAGSSQNLLEPKENESQRNTANEAECQSRTDSQQTLARESGSQQLRSAPEENNTYRSEEHRHVYQNQSYSFNEQRGSYAEQALNESIPQVQEETQGTDNAGRYQRYVGQGKDGALDSIFQASDLELADATENYLDLHSRRFQRRISHLYGDTGKTMQKMDTPVGRRLAYRNSYRPWKHRFVVEEKKNLLHKDTGYTNGGLFGNRLYKTETTQVAGRLKFRSLKIARSEQQSARMMDRHSRKVKKRERRADRKEFYYRKLKKDLRDTLSGSGFQEDAVMSELDQKRRRAAYAATRLARTNVRKLKHTFDGYERLKFQKARMASLAARMERLSYKSGIDLQKRKAKEAARQGLLREERKRKIKKQMVQNYKRQQGNFITRVRTQHQLKKTVKKEKKMARKRVKTIISSVLMLLILLIFIVMIVFMLMTILFDMGGEAMVNTVSQNDYYDMTDVTKYFRNKEAELEEYLKPDSNENPENLESVILAEEPDIFEFIYDLDEISFDANTLVAYLSARYNEFDLELVKEDLDEIFGLYYTLEWEIKEEYREEAGGYVKICYITLRKADFYELLKDRIGEAAKQAQMEGFYLSGNGQQVYGPVMNVDWRKKISSNYGYRIHPITGVKTFHDGVDIAVPTGTALYSAVEGTVIRSYYSDSGGNVIVIQNESGWQVTFMHMDGRAVNAGDTVKQGQYVGTSGNTGNSTGPHLHIRIHDAEDQPVNPVFVIPFSTLEASESL